MVQSPPKTTSVFDFESRLGQKADLIESSIPQFVTGDSRLVEIMRYALRGGKGIRGACVLEVSGAYGVSQSTALPVAVATECVQAYSLIHDDLPCMDDADLRRGKPSAHKKFDEASALLAGDALLTIAFEILALADLQSHITRQLIRSLSHAIGCRGMVLGQMMDLSLERNKVSSFDGVMRVGLLKTGAFFSFACTAGAILAEAPEEDQGILKTFGEDFGIFFQVQDDYLDMYGNPKDTGKPAGNDEEKITATDYLDKESLKAFMSEKSQHLHSILNELSVDIPFLRDMFLYNQCRVQ